MHGRRPTVEVPDTYVVGRTDERARGVFSILAEHAGLMAVADHDLTPGAAAGDESTEAVLPEDMAES